MELRLTSKQIKALTTPGKYRVATNLALRVYPSGQRAWSFEYKWGDEPRAFTLGSVDDIPLTEALDLAKHWRAVRQKGNDPKREFDRQRRTAVSAKRFDACAMAWFAVREQRVADGTLDSRTVRINRGVYAHLAATALARTVAEDVDIDHVLEATKPLWQTKRGVCYAALRLVENVLDFATANGWRTSGRENPARKSIHKAAGLPPLKRSTPRRAMHHDDVAAFVRALLEVANAPLRFTVCGKVRIARSDITSRRYATAILLLLATAVRPHNVAQARREHFDLKRKLWHIPGHMMKGRRAEPPDDHYVPLTDFAISIVEAALSRLDGEPTGPLFPIPRGPVRRFNLDRDHIVDLVAAECMLYSIGYATREARRDRRGRVDYRYILPFDKHGFRGCISTWANDQSIRNALGELVPRFGDRDVDRVLAHKATSDQTAEGHYNFAQALARRRAILDAFTAEVILRNPNAAVAANADDNIIPFKNAVRVRRNAP